MASPLLFKDIESLLTMAPAMKKQGRHILEEDLGEIKNAAVLIQNGKILWVGKTAKIPKNFFANKKEASRIKEVSLKGQTVLPGFVECHTHSVFSGSRADEFELRNQGMPYQEIARRGGGILSTMRATRKSSLADLKTLTQNRIQQFYKQGVTTLEIKSGYALDLKNELKMLQVVDELSLKKNKSPHLISTYLGAHALPPEFKNTSEYTEYILEKVLPQVLKKTLCRRIDIFVEKGFFEKEIALNYLQKAQKMGFQITIHADQLSLSGGSDLAMQLKASSADHVIQLSEKQISGFAKSETTAVLLPMADLYMKCAYPPARELIDAGARVALATDFNPGSCPAQDLSLVGLLARLQMKMSLPEVIAAYTVGSSFALGLQDQVGSLSENKNADIIATPATWRDLFYSAGADLQWRVL
jgi:imidazolonepropionase